MYVGVHISAVPFPFTNLSPQYTLTTGGVPDASTSGPKRGQPRGGKAAGRRPGGKGQAGATEGAYNPFKIKDASIKRGKRSSTVTMKSGNRSTYF